MKEQSGSRLAHGYKIASAAASVFSAAVGISGLVGSAFHIRGLVTWGVEPVTMKVNTALCFVLAGVALWLLREESPTSRGRSAGRFGALLLCVLALLSAVEFFINLDLRLDQSFIRALPNDTVALRQPALMSPITAFNFLMFAVALLLIDWRTKNRDWPAQYFCVAGALGTSVGILGVLFQPLPTSITLAAPTTVGFVALTCGVVCARARWAVGGLLTSKSAGAKWMRRAGLSAIVVLILFGWLLSKPLLTSDHFTWVQFSAIVILAGALLVSLLVWTALLLNQTELERRRAELALRMCPEKLDWFTGRYEDMPLDINIRRWSAAGILLGIALTGLGGYLSSWSVRQATEDANWVSHTHAVIAALESTLAHTVDIETGGRGFAATGDERYLDPLVAARPALDSDLAALRKLTTDNAFQQQRLLQLRSETDARGALVEDLMAERSRIGGVPAAAAFMKGKQAMDAVRATIAEMQDEESHLLDQRTERSEAARLRTTAITLFSTLSGVLLLLVAGLVTRREIADSSRMRGQLQTLNADLERRVAERTSALQESQQRLQGIFDSALDSIIAVDEERRIVLFNEAAQKTFLCSAAQAMGRLIDDFIPERSHGVHADHVRRFAETGVTSRTMSSLGELWALRANGEDFQIEASLSQTGIAGKKIFTVILRDVTEQKVAEKAQRALASIVTFSHDAIIGKNLDGIVTSWNPGAEEIYGYSAAEMIGRPITTLTPPDHVDDFDSIMQTIKNGEILRHYECVRMRKDRQPIHVSLSVGPMRDDAGKIVGASTIARDITERKRAEEALVESQEQFRALFNAMLIGFALLEPIYDETGKPCDFRYRAVNPAFETHCGLSRNQVLGKTIREVLPTLEPIWIENYGKVAITGGSIHFERYAEPLGRWLELTVFRTLRGEVAVTFADITESRKAETEIRRLNEELEERVQQRTAQLRESEQSVRRKLNGIMSPEGDLGSLELRDILDIPAIQVLMEAFHSVVRGVTALLDLDGNILSAVGWQDICVKFHRVNPDSCRNCKESDLELSKGVASGEFKLYKCKNSFWDASTPIVVGDRHMGNLYCGQFFLADEPIDYEFFRRQARKYGFNEQDYMAALESVPRLTREEVNASMTFLAKMAEMISQLSYSGIKLARSMTAKDRANEELATAIKELEAFTYSVSHDLRAPLRHISGFSKMLVEQFGAALPPDAQHYLERIQSGTRRMGMLVDDLLNLGRIGRQALRLQVAGLRSIVDEVIEELQPECVDREIEWKIADLPFLDCDPGLLRQVLQNLLSNALKFTRPRAHAIIEIGQMETGEGKSDISPVIFVRDNGVGFSMKYADKLFGVFQRLHRQEDFEGTGVGLATVQRIIQKHRGRIWAEAELDRGATFYFTIGEHETNETETQAALAGEIS